jgi:hypothetical protein
VEHHRAEQKALEDRSADEIWDLKEEFRFEREDRESSYEAACQKIREATKAEALQENFQVLNPPYLCDTHLLNPPHLYDTHLLNPQEVLEVLEGIQGCYRAYHSNACFANDRFPLYLSSELRQYLDTLSGNFFLQPDACHRIVQEYERVFDQVGV